MPGFQEGILGSGAFYRSVTRCRLKQVEILVAEDFAATTILNSVSLLTLQHWPLGSKK